MPSEDCRIRKCIKDFSLDNSRDFIANNSDKIVFITSANDILTSAEELKYIEEHFTNRVIIPFGGHTGILWHRDVAELMVNKMEEN